MATWTPTAVAGQVGLADTERPATTWEISIDLTTTSGAYSVNSGAGLTSGDVVKLIPIPKGAVVLAVGMEVITAFTAATTLSVGDSGSATRYLAATSVATTGYKVTSPTAFIYGATDNIQVTVGGANPTVGKVRVFAVVAQGLANLPAGTAVL